MNKLDEIEADEIEWLTIEQGGSLTCGTIMLGMSIGTLLWIVLGVALYLLMSI